MGARKFLISAEVSGSFGGFDGAVQLPGSAAVLDGGVAAAGLEIVSPCDVVSDEVCLWETGSYTFQVGVPNSFCLGRSSTVEVVVAAAVAPLFAVACTPGAVGPLSSGSGAFVGSLGGSYTAAGGSGWSVSVSAVFTLYPLFGSVSAFPVSEVGIYLVCRRLARTQLRCLWRTALALAAN